MLTIDGAQGEGGGQILRSSLALSMVTGRPVRIERIRAGRKKSGLMRQHLTAVRAAQRVSSAHVTGDAIGSAEVTFEPGPVEGGDFQFSIGTAGSTTLVLQAILPALVLAERPSTVVLEGGTHNPFAPPFDFLARTFLPVLSRMGPSVVATLERPGFFPAGGGRIRVEVEPVSRLRPVSLEQRGDIVRRAATATVANLSPSIADRELKMVARKLNWPPKHLEVRELRDTPGPGNILTIDVESTSVCEVFTGFGELRRPAEDVANQAIRQCRDYLKSEAPVGEYLADQLLLPMAIAGSGSFRTTRLTRHATTHIDLIRMFLDCRVETDETKRGDVFVGVC
ncbi:MAG: RNA 3'-phosphate cyclase [Phycisphaeraceae bacterium]|nr:RNA 3'-phosphate cyclase [Phycisphaeraceae bacterium]